ncbi:hypothetical protein B0H19DRAFT_1057343 [Mycena capillaripes]|nr:hypothetical protein B0H19DRAFT_1057343 [Mycena capillaripes]
MDPDSTVIPADLLLQRHLPAPDPRPSKSALKLFWSKLQQAIPLLLNLKTLNICYSVVDAECLHRYIIEGNFSHSLPSSLGTLHLKPLPEEDGNNEGELWNVGPWDESMWRLSISLIPYIHTLIVTSPTYIIWPLTQDRLDLTLAEWTAQLCRRSPSSSPSTLTTIVLNCGYGDRAQCAVDYEDFSDDGQEPIPDIFEPKNILDGHLVGSQIVWERTAPKEWGIKNLVVPSTSNREEYFFGTGGRAYLRPYFHINEVVVAQEWRSLQIDNANPIATTWPNRCLMHFTPN